MRIERPAIFLLFIVMLFVPIHSGISFIVIICVLFANIQGCFLGMVLGSMTDSGRVSPPSCCCFIEIIGDVKPCKLTKKNDEENQENSMMTAAS